MQLSVIIPTYNRAHTLIRALTSVVSQTSAVDEIIVVDDGSTDHSVELIQNHFPQVTLIQQPNRGVSAARNVGIQKARHEWIALLDSDDEWLPSKIEVIRQTHLSQPQLRIIHSNEIWVRNGVRVNAMNKHQKAGGWIFKQCLPLCVISPSAVVIHKSILDQIGLFDESLPACEDYHLWLRLCHRFEVFYIDQPLIIKYGGHDDQLSRQFWGMDRFRIRALHHLKQLDTLSEEQQQLTTHMLQRKLRILLKGAHKHGNQNIIDEFQPLMTHYESLPC